MDIFMNIPMMMKIPSVIYENQFDKIEERKQKRVRGERAVKSESNLLRL